MAGLMTIGGYITLLIAVFLLPPFVIMIARRYGWSEKIDLRRLLMRAPLQGRMKGLLLQNVELSRRPLNQQLDTFLYSRSNYGLAIDMVQAALSLVSCALVVYSSTFPFTEPDPDWALYMETALTSYFALDYALRFFLAQDRLAFYFSPLALLDYVTIMPSLLSMMISPVHMDANAFIVNQTLRVFRIFRVVRLMRIVALSTSSSLTRQFLVLAITVLAMVFAAAAIFQILDSTPTKFLPFHHAVLYMTITIIGRPPVPTNTDAAKIMETITIFLGSFIIPAFIAELARLYFEQQGREVYASDPKVPHVILCGDVNPSRLRAFLAQFFHKSRDPEQLSPLVVLSEQKYEGPLKTLIEQSRYAGSVKYLRGSARKPADLKRAAAVNASTVIILSHGRDVDAGAADSEIVSACLAVKNINRRVRVLTQIRRPKSRDHLMCLPGWRDVDRAVAISSLSMTLLGVGSLLPGLPTLLTNLVHQGNKKNARSSNPRRRKTVSRQLKGIGGAIQGQAAGMIVASSSPWWAAPLVALLDVVEAAGSAVVSSMARQGEVESEQAKEEAAKNMHEMLQHLLRPMSPVEEYTSGFAQEMFAFAVTPGFTGRPFATCARAAYLRFGVLLIGARVPLDEKGRPVIGSTAPTHTSADEAERMYQVRLFPADLVLQPGMYLHAIAFDALDLAALLTATGGMDLALRMAAAAGGAPVDAARGSSAMHKSSTTATLFDHFGRGKKDNDAWPHNKAALRDLSVPWCFTENEQENATAVITALDAAGYTWKHTELGKKGNLPPGVPLHQCACHAHARWAEQCKTAQTAGVFAALQSVLKGHAASSHVGLVGSPGGVAMPGGHTAAAPAQPAVPFDATAGPTVGFASPTAGVPSSRLGLPPAGPSAHMERPPLPGAGHSAVARSPGLTRSGRKPARARLNSDAVDALFDDDADGLGPGLVAPTHGKGVGHRGVSVNPMSAFGSPGGIAGAGGAAPRVLSSGQSFMINGGTGGMGLGFGRIEEAPAEEEEDDAGDEDDDDGELGGEEVDDEDDMGLYGMGAEEDDGTLSEGGPTDGESIGRQSTHLSLGSGAGPATFAGSGSQPQPQSASIITRGNSLRGMGGHRPSFSMARATMLASEGTVGPADVEPLPTALDPVRHPDTIIRSRSRPIAIPTGTLVRQGTVRTRAPSDEKMHGRGMVMVPASIPHPIGLAPVMRAHVAGTASLFSVRGILARAAANPALVPAFFKGRRHMALLNAHRSLITPYRDHILVCGMSDSIGLLLRALMTPPPMPPKATGSNGLASLLSDQVSLFVERRAMALVSHGTHGKAGKGGAGGGVTAVHTAGMSPADKAAAALAAIPMHLRHLPIVVLCAASERPSDAAINLMHQGSSRWLQRVSFTTGNPTDMTDLLRAGVESARAAVVLSTKRPQANPDGTDNLADDTDAIVVASAIYKLNPSLHVLTEVIHGPHASYLRPLGSTLQDAEESSAIAATRKQQEEARQRYEAKQRRAVEAAARRAEAAKAKAAGLDSAASGSPSSVVPAPAVPASASHSVSGAGAMAGHPLAAAIPSNAAVVSSTADVSLGPVALSPQLPRQASTGSLSLSPPAGPVTPARDMSALASPGLMLDSPMTVGMASPPGQHGTGAGATAEGRQPMAPTIRPALGSGPAGVLSPGVDTDSPLVDVAAVAGIAEGTDHEADADGEDDGDVFDEEDGTGSASSTINAEGGTTGAIASRLARERIKLALASGDTVGRATLAIPRGRTRPTLASVFAPRSPEGGAAGVSPVSVAESAADTGLSPAPDASAPSSVLSSHVANDSMGSLTGADGSGSGSGVVTLGAGAGESLPADAFAFAGARNKDGPLLDGPGSSSASVGGASAVDTVGLDLSFDGQPSLYPSGPASAGAVTGSPGHGGTAADPWSARGAMASGLVVVDSGCPAPVASGEGNHLRSRTSSMSGKTMAEALTTGLSTVAAVLTTGRTPMLPSTTAKEEPPSIALEVQGGSATSGPASSPGQAQAKQQPRSHGSTLAGYAMDQSVAIAAAAEAAAKATSSGPVFVGPPPKMAAPSDIFGAPAFAAGRAFSATTLDALMCEAHFAPHILFIIKQLVKASRKQRLQLLPVADAVAMGLLVAPVGPGSALNSSTYMAPPPVVPAASPVSQASSSGRGGASGAAGAGILTGSDWDDGVTNVHSGNSNSNGTPAKAGSRGASVPTPLSPGTESVSVAIDAAPPMATSVMTGATAALLQAVYTATHGASGVPNAGAVSVPKLETYGQLFESLLRGWHLLPVGLYRRVQPGAQLQPPVVPDPVSHFVAAFASPAAAAAAATLAPAKPAKGAPAAPVQPLSTAAAQMAEISRTLGGTPYAGYTGSAAFSHERSLLSYVFTNPPPDTILNSSDYVYVLRQAEDDDGEEW